MIRFVKSEDTSAVMSIAEAIGFFSPEELGLVSDMLTNSLAGTGDQHPFWLADDENGIVGIAYCEPERMTDKTWNLLLIAVHPEQQKKGRGKLLLRSVEEALIKRQARVLLIETLGTPDFEHVRNFYLKSGYEQEARIRDFYAKGFDKIVFRKVFAA